MAARRVSPPAIRQVRERREPQAGLLERAIRAESRAEALEARLREIIDERDEWKGAFQRLTDSVIFQSGHRLVFDPTQADAASEPHAAQPAPRPAVRTAREWRSQIAPKLMDQVERITKEEWDLVNQQRSQQLNRLRESGDKVIEQGA